MRWFGAPRSWFAGRAGFGQKAFHRFLRAMRLVLGVRTQGFEAFPKTGPVVVIAPHASFLDPVALFVALPRPSRFLSIAFFVFRSAWLSWLQCLAGALPVVRHRPDPSAVLRALRLLSFGEVVGLFPEGGRSWTGVPESVMPQAARLVASVTCPVFVVAIDGSYDLWPRWAASPRRRPLTVRLMGPIRFPKTSVAQRGRGGPFAVFAPRGRRAVSPAVRRVLAALREAASGQAASLSWDVPGRLSGIRALLSFCPFCARGPLSAEPGALFCVACRTRFLAAPDGALRFEQSTGVAGTEALPQLFHRMGRVVAGRAQVGFEIRERVKVREFAAGEADPSVARWYPGEAALSKKGMEVSFAGVTRRVPIERFREAQVEGIQTIEIASEDPALRLHLGFQNGAMSWIVSGRALLGLRHPVPGP